MPKFIIYHNPKCSKSRQTLELLKENSTDIEIVEYLKTPLTEKELSTLISQLDGDPKSLVRTKEDLYREEKPKIDSKEDVAKTLAKYPKLMERPVVISGDRAVIGRPPENVKVFFE